VTRLGVPVDASGAISEVSCALVPKNCPPELIAGSCPAPLGVVVYMNSVPKSASGACGENACHARTAAAASDHGQTTW
jgi:hypothetical protein